MDVSFMGRVPMTRHAEFKYLVHLDGQGWVPLCHTLLTVPNHHDFLTSAFTQSKPPCSCAIPLEWEHIL